MLSARVAAGRARRPRTPVGATQAAQTREAVWRAAGGPGPVLGWEHGPCPAGWGPVGRRAQC